MKEAVVLQRLAKVRSAMREQEVDALVLQKDEKINSVDPFYISGFSGSSAWIVVTADRAVFMTDSRYTEQAKRECYGMEVYDAEGRLTPVQLWEEWMPRALGNAKRIGIMEGEVLLRFYTLMKRHFPDIEIVPIPSILKDIRALKDEAEVKKIELSIRATENALQQAFASIRPGVSEQEIAEVFQSSLPRGAKLAFDSIIASGARSILPHGRASEKIIETGDVVQFDVGCVLDGYVSDLSRVVICGKASPEQKRMHRAVLAVVKGALELYRPGERFVDAQNRADEILRSLGYSELPHALGHGIGLECHEAPFPVLDPVEGYAFEVGHVATVEPGVYSEELGFGMRIELDVLITPDGPEILDRLPWRRLVETDKF